MLIILLVLSALQLSAQPPGGDPAEETPTIRITSTLVQTDAVVTDSHGAPVTDLTAADFEVVQKGARRDIVSFSLVRPEPSSASSVSATRDSIRRTVLIVVDDLGLSFESVAWTRRALMKFFERDLAEGDLVAVASTGGGMGIYQQFTRDRRILAAAAERLAWNARTRNRYQALLPSLLSAGAASNSAFSQALAGPGAPVTRDDQLRAEAQDRRIQDLQSYELSYQGSQSSITNLIRAMKNMPGRKSMVLFSEGMRTGSTGRNRFVESSWVLTLTDAAARSAVAIYTVDPAPPSPEAIAAGNMLTASLDGTLYTLAEQTGGLYLGNPADLDKAVQRAFDDQGSYYLLGFRPPNGEFDGKYHELEVRLKRKGLTLRTRRGYLAREDAPEAPRTDTGRLVDALLSPFVPSGIGMKATALFFLNPTGKPLVQAMVWIDARDLTFTQQADARHHTAIEIVITGLDSDGRRGAAVRQAYQLSLDEPRYQSALRDGLTYRVAYPFDRPGGVEVRAALIEKNTEKVGSARDFLEVPAWQRDRVSLSGILLVKAESSDPMLAARTLVAGGRLAWNAQVYTKVKTPLRYTIRILHDGKVLGQAPEQTFAPGPGPYTDISGDLGLNARLPAGRYFLELDVNGDKKTHATQTVDFEVSAPAN